MNDEMLLRRRETVLGPCYFHFFERPLHLVRGEGVWLWDSSGRRYLDCYNNVPSVGHCHPTDVEALSNQAATLNINTRYLHENIIRLGERLVAKLPPALDTCMFVCTGSEANDLAVQMARRFTGRQGCVVTEGAYHGNTHLVLQLSPGSYPQNDRPDWLGVIEAPDSYRGRFRGDNAGSQYAEEASRVIDTMIQKGHPPAAMLVDSIWDAPGPLRAPDHYLDTLCEKMKSVGGLVIADEVQSGYCRLGDHWWGFEHYGVEPDFVTMGKPMGDGHPLAAVITRRQIADVFAKETGYFNTFGGNPVSTAAGNAGLDVIDGEGLLTTVGDSGRYLTEKLKALAERHSCIGAVTGRGLFQGLDLVKDPETKAPFSSHALKRIATLIAEEGVLVGTSGLHGQTIKLRPPLPFKRQHADIASDAVDRALTRYSAER
ncbi:MAG: aminotransferase class III-fold pyridoxal phosphate-dependent enzyme [Limibacillus sp.]